MVSFLFSFRGRINRQQYWAGSLGVGVGAIVLIFVLALLAGVAAPMDKQSGLQGGVALILIIGVVGLIGGWSGLALQTKRFHDRNQPGWLTLLPLLPMCGLAAAMIGADSASQTPTQLVGSMQPYLLALWAINFFFFINLGCLAGTDGPNRHGPPPGAAREPSSHPRRPAQPTAAFGNVEVAMERAIAARAREAAKPLEAAAARPPVSAASTTAVFGRRPAH